MLLNTADAKAHANDPTGLDGLNQENAFDKANTQPLARNLGFNSCTH